ncbi:MAG TPA: hypothetical protein VG675_25610 [Bryobacteraceae bacterium]|nr:hypothetical protein [Bryobacteraceae bacterium]
MTPLDLDLGAAKTAQAIIKDVEPTKKAAKAAEDLITKTLTVIQENGPYAAIVFLCANTNGGEKDLASSVRANLLDFAEQLGATGLAKSGDFRKILDSVIKNVCSDLDMLLLVKQAWEQVLIYARHSAKSLKAQVGA